MEAIAEAARGNLEPLNTLQWLYSEGKLYGEHAGCRVSCDLLGRRRSSLFITRLSRGRY